MNENMISCDQHDYVEIACMYGLEVELLMKSSQTFRGNAKTLFQLGNQEYLVLTHSEEVKIALNQIKKMRAITSNPHFSEVLF